MLSGFESLKTLDIDFHLGEQAIKEYISHYLRHIDTLNGESDFRLKQRGNSKSALSTVKSNNSYCKDESNIASTCSGGHRTYSSPPKDVSKVKLSISSLINVKAKCSKVSLAQESEQRRPPMSSAKF